MKKRNGFTGEKSEIGFWRDPECHRHVGGRSPSAMWWSGSGSCKFRTARIALKIGGQLPADSPDSRGGGVVVLPGLGLCEKQIRSVGSGCFLSVHTPNARTFGGDE